MVEFILRSGNKSPQDCMVFLVAKDEVLTFQEILFILLHIFNSENDYYPISDGNLGKGMMISAICCLAIGVPIKTILKKFKLPMKKLRTLDLRNNQPKKQIKRVISENTPIAELM